MTKITFIWHDCFMVELSTMTMVFDYWKDPMAYPGKLPGFLAEADKSKPLYVFVSHHHKDHYSKRIFEWSRHFEKITYIISKDTARHCRHILNADSLYSGVKPKPEDIVILECGEKFSDNLIKAEAFDSTDIGNSYYVETNSPEEENPTFFHAGDLNAWLWVDESTPKEVEDAIQKYTTILKTLSTNHPKMDYVMFPVDSRIGTDYYTGAKLFVRSIEVKHFFPMHFCLGQDPEESQRFAIDAAKVEFYANSERGEYICLQSPYSVFLKS